MTEISEAAKAKAWAICQRDGLAWEEYLFRDHIVGAAFARFIQEVSDAAKLAEEATVGAYRHYLAPFILSEPVDPVDPVESALQEAWKQALSVYHATHIDKGAQDAACIRRFRHVLEQRGIELARERQP